MNPVSIENDIRNLEVIMGDKDAVVAAPEPPPVSGKCPRCGGSEDHRTGARPFGQFSYTCQPGTLAEAKGEESPFQTEVTKWLYACFGEAIAKDQTERNHRFLEESLELVQSLGCTRSEAAQLVDYVFNRPVGEPKQECGGVMVTLAALCFAANMDMGCAGETELIRVWGKIEKIRAKQAAKPKHSPLPEPPTPPTERATPETEFDRLKTMKDKMTGAQAKELVALITGTQTSERSATPKVDDVFFEGIGTVEQINAVFAAARNLERDRNSLRLQLNELESVRITALEQIAKLNAEMQRLRHQWESDETGTPGRALRDACDTLSRVCGFPLVDDKVQLLETVGKKVFRLELDNTALRAEVERLSADKRRLEALAAWIRRDDPEKQFVRLERSKNDGEDCRIVLYNGRKTCYFMGATLRAAIDSAQNEQRL